MPKLNQNTKSLKLDLAEEASESETEITVEDWVAVFRDLAEYYPAEMMVSLFTFDPPESILSHVDPRCLLSGQ